MTSYDPLVGLEFSYDNQNCYSLVRSFYRLVFGIELSDYAAPTDFWKADLDLYNILAHEEGFEPLHCHPREYQFGDVVICAIQSSIGNTAAVLLHNNQLLVHLVGQRSTVVPFGGMFRNNCVAVYRHKDAPPVPEAPPLDVRTLLPPNVARRIAEIEMGGDGA